MLQHTHRPRPPRTILLALLCPLLVGLALPPMPAAHAATPPPLLAPYDCEGGACASVTLSWENEGQRFRADNSSSQRVRVTVTTFAGDSWVIVEPQASGYLGVKSFNGAYRAEFE